MRRDRRQFLGLSFATGLSVGFQSAFGSSFADAKTAGKSLRSLPAFLDTLIPEDESASATGAGIDQKLLKNAASHRLYGGLLRLGCWWLDREARKSGGVDFRTLAQAKREEIVARAEASARGTLPRAFFDTVRKDAFELYYADARVWTSLRYDGPPQPGGVLDHADPPGRSRQ